MSHELIRGQWGLKFLLISGEARSSIRCWPRLLSWKLGYIWTEFLLAFVTDCPFQLSSFVLCLPHMTLTTCACWYLPSNIYLGQFPPPPNLCTVFRSSLFNSLPFLFVYLVLKSFPPESSLTWFLGLRYSTVFNIILFACISLSYCLSLSMDCLWPPEWAFWFKAKLLPSPS